MVWLKIAFGLLAVLVIPAQAQTAGRAILDKRNCTQCHFHEARGFGPSIKKMKQSLKGDPVQASAEFSASANHGGDLQALSRDDIRVLSEWLAGTTFEAAAAATLALKQTPAEAAAAKREAEAKLKREQRATARQAAEATAAAAVQAKKDALAKATRDKESRAQAKRDNDAQAAREAAAKIDAAGLARREADAKARKDTAALDAIKRETDEKNRREAEVQAQAKRDAEARAKRDSEILAAQQKRDADALAAQKQEAEAAQKKAADTAAQKQAATDAAKKVDAAPKIDVAKIDPAAKADTGGAGGKKQMAYRDGSDLPACEPPTGAPVGAVDDDKAKAIMERVGCSQCHAYVQKKTGPPMKKIQEKYKGDWECVMSRLKKNKTHSEEGVTAELKGNEFKIIADYIATRNK